MKKILTAVPALILALSIVGCGAQQNDSSKLASEPATGSAKDLIIPGIRFCGVDEAKVVDDAFEKFIEDLGKKCAEQNEILRKAGFPECGGLCTVRFGAGDQLPTRTVQVLLNYNAQFNMPWINVTFGAPPALPEKLLGQTLVCEHPNILAVSHYNIRQKIVDAIAGGLPYCTYN